MIEALGSNIIVKPIKESAQTPGGILLPDRAKKDPKFGTVEFIGSEVEFLKAGDIVILSQYIDNTVEIDGIEYYICCEKNIQVKISKETQK